MTSSSSVGMDRSTMDADGGRLTSSVGNLLIDQAKCLTSLPLPSADDDSALVDGDGRRATVPFGVHDAGERGDRHALHPSCSTAVDIAVGDQQQPSAEAAQLTRAHHKHVFILSDAGKPVYTRYGTEEDMAACMGVIQALVSFVSNCAQCDDQLISMRVGRHQFVFCHFAPLILCTVSRCGGVTVAHLQNQLHCLYRYIGSVLTAAQLRRIFDERKNFDLRRLLTGTRRTLDRLLDSAETDYCLMLNAVPSLALSNSLKESIVQAIVSQCAQAKAVIYAVLLVNDQLVLCSSRKGHQCLAWYDLHLLINLVASNPSFRNAESWSPVCLSGYDENLFLSAHISYLGDNSPACLLLLTDDRAAFFELSAARTAIIQKLTKVKALTALNEAAQQLTTANDFVVQDLIHFVYKLNSKQLYTSMTVSPVCAGPAFRDYLFGRYLRLHGYVRQNRRAANNRCVYYASGSLDAMLGWATQSFELYAAFNPLVTKTEAVGRVDQLMRWIKKEEPNLFATVNALH